MALYEYEPIDLDGHSFRLIRLRRGRSGIQCELFHAWLDDTDTFMEYEALSYTWGDELETWDIEVNGKHLPVTTNLALALKHLRYPDQDRILWIDAICIDQSNTKERGHQVEQMSMIYQRADRVLIWLGIATVETDFVLDSIRDLEKESRRHACKGWQAADERWQDLWSRNQPLLQADGNHRLRQREGLNILLRRPWFRRVWILQEVANARAARVICGHRSVSERMFALAPALLEILPDPHCQAVLDIFPGRRRADSWWAQSRSLKTLLSKFKDCQASDMRDKIYALLGIATDTSGVEIMESDYGKTLDDVIQDALAFMLGIYEPKDMRPCLPQWEWPELLAHLPTLGNAVFSWAMNNEHGAAVRPFPDTNKAGLSTECEYGRVSPVSLSCAAQNGHETLVRGLLDSGNLDVNYKDSEGLSPLLQAARHGSKSIVKLLVNTGRVDVDWMGLWRQSRGAAIELLLDTDGIDHIAGRLLLEVAKDGQIAEIEHILRKGMTQVNFQDERKRTPLSWAADYGNKAMVRQLLANEAEVDIPDQYKHTPLWLAASGGHEAVVKMLLSTSKVNINFQDYHHSTPLLSAARGPHEETVRLLLDTGEAEVNTKDKDGRTPLLWAADCNCKAVVKLLLDTGQAEVNTPDKDGNRPLLLAARHGREEIVRLLLNTGEAEVNFRDTKGQTPLSLAAKSGHEAIARLLLDTGKAEVNLPDLNGRTPLSWAADNVHVPIVELLLSTGRARMGTRYSQRHYYLPEQREDLDKIAQLLEQHSRSALPLESDALQSISDSSRKRKRA